MPSVRTVVRTLIAALLIAAPLLVALEVPAAARTGNSFSGTDQAASHSLTISIDSVSPQWAQPGKQITVHGTVTNNTGSPVSGLQIAIQTESTAAFSFRSTMETYAAGGAVSSAYLATTPVGTPYTLPGTFHSGTTLSWSVSFPASEAGYTQFGVYPLAAVLYSSSLASITTDRTLLPYWAGSTAPDPVRVSWLWPLVNQPQQSPCPQTLAGNALATSMAPSGRLGRLLSTGLKGEAQAKLTWAVDPALLSDAQTMTKPYKVGGNAGCTGTTGEPASKAATTWLSTLRTDAAGEPMFVTPYADADVSALANAGMTANLRSAYTLGDEVAHESLERPFGKNGGGTGDGGAPSVAWLAGGTAGKGVLTALANTGRINTAVLSSDEDPSAMSAVSSMTTGAGTSMRVLLADSQLTSLLGTSNGRSSAGEQFATEQDFLAETAMIVAELPYGSGRSLVIAPPQRWSPSAAEADTLLSESNAPWLRPTLLSDLTPAPSDPQKLPGGPRDAAELSSSYMNLVRFTGDSLRTYQDLLAQPSSGTTQSLQEALTATTSTAWRGSGNGAGTATLINLANFMRDAEQKVQIIGGKKWLLAGASGDVAVSVQNGMSQPVQVRVQVSDPDASQLSIGTFNDLIPIAAGGTATVKVPVHASGIETTTMQLQLVTRNGSPLPTPSQPLTVQVTRYGRALIILIAAALGVVVLASAARWIRQWRSGTRAGSGGTA
jgi:uncharacterized protein DUF6049